MIMGDVEGEAAWLLRGFERAPGARALVARHLGERAIRTVPWRGGGDARVHIIAHQPTICVRSKLSKEAFRWAVLHELAEWHLARVGYRGEDIESVAESLTAALVVPRGSYIRALKAHGRAWAQLAFDFTASQTCLALRHGEVTNDPIAVVAPLTVRARGGGDDFAWGSERELRRAARDGRPGLRRAGLTDDRRRVVLVVDDAIDRDATG